MPSTPPPGAAPAAANNPTADWRSSVLQSYRNAEVREISKVLAALEGSASVTPASKLMLAMRFEDQIFKSAKDLGDYRKKISKRLKKLQKNYKAPAKQAAGASPAAGAAGKGAAAGTGASADNTEAKAVLTAKLQRDYGEELRYIVTHAQAAVADLGRKLGPDKARQLRQHTDSCRVWARDLGILTADELQKLGSSSGSGNDEAKASVEPQQQPLQQQQQQPQSTPQSQQQQQQQQQQPQASKPNEPSKPSSVSNQPVPQSLAQLQRIEKHLKTRVANIRSYVVKHADPDQFLLETLQQRDAQFAKNPQAGNLLRAILQSRLQTQWEQLQKANSGTTTTNPSGQPAATETTPKEDPLVVLQKALEQALAPVPMATRTDDKTLEAALMHLDKMRAASQAMTAYWTLPGDQRLDVAPRETLPKIHAVVQEGADRVVRAVRALESKKPRAVGQRPRSGSSPGAATKPAAAATTSLLQDAWSKTIELPSEAAGVDEQDEANTTAAAASASGSPTKRARTARYPPYFRTRCLLRRGKQLPPPLLQSIRQRGAVLKQSDSGVHAAHLVVDFGAFDMTVYFSPLAVALRAKPQTNHHGGETATASHRSSLTSPASAPWKPLSYGLTPWGATLDASDFLRHRTNNTDDDEPPSLSCWGVAGDYRSIGRVVEERLRDASTHATAVLRRCFRNHVKDKTVGYEVEILEGSALVEFLMAAQGTYQPASTPPAAQAAH